MKIVGLTGGIGSGKTTVANYFKDLGIPIYIADDAGKKLMDSSEGLKKEIIQVFGEQAYKNGILDRKYIAAQVFNTTQKLEKLNSIVHPAVKKDFGKWLKNQETPYIIYEAAILFESGGYKKCDLVILVTANYNERIERLLKRDKSSVAEIEARMKHQWSDEKKLQLADYQIQNSDFTSTRNQVRNIHDILLKPSKN